MGSFTVRRPVAGAFGVAALATLLLAAAQAACLLVASTALAVTLPGDVLWQKTTAVSGSSGFVELARGPSGTVYAVGARDYKAGGKDCECILLAKYTASGALRWKRSLAGGAIPHGSSGSGVAVDATGNATVCGLKNSAAHGGDIVVARYSPAGKLLWSRTYNGPANDLDQAFDMAVDRYGNAYVAGTTWTATHDFNVLLLKYRARTGRRLWKYTWNESIANLGDGADAVVLDHGGAAYVTGWSADAGNVNGAVPVIKVSAGGTPRWVVRVHAGSFGDGERIALDSAGAVVVGGDCIGAGGSRDLFAAKFSPATGVLPWTPRVIPVAYDQQLTDMVVGHLHDDIYLVGYGDGPFPMGVVADFSKDGALLWNPYFTPDDHANGSLAWKAVAVGAHDDLYIAGRDLSPTHHDIFEVGKMAWDGTWPLWQTRIQGSVPGDTTPMDVLWVGGTSGGVYACGALTMGGIDYAYIAKLKP